MLLFQEVISLIENSSGLKPIPTLTISAFGLVISRACFNAMFAPEHSITSPRLSLPQISVHLATTSSLEPFTQCVAPSSLATPNLTFVSSSRPTITMFTAPISFATCTENKPSGPVPNTTTSCPLPSVQICFIRRFIRLSPDFQYLPCDHTTRLFSRSEPDQTPDRSL